MAGILSFVSNLGNTGPIANNGYNPVPNLASKVTNGASAELGKAVQIIGQPGTVQTPAQKQPTGGQPQAAPAPNNAASAAAAALNAARGDYNTSLNSANSSINDAIGTGAQGYRSSILDYLDSRKQQRNTIDNQSVQNELAREQGMQGIMDMVGNGVKSGGVVLANNNAGTSSAGEALARAYGTIGRQQASSVGNQFAQGQNQIQTLEDNLTASDATQTRHSQEDKATTINGIVNSARQQLASLNQSAAYASIPDRVDIEGKIAAIKQQAMDALGGYDQQLTGGIQSQRSLNGGDIRAKANSLLTAGVAPDSAFNYTTDVPTQFQDTGQFASSLPIFTSPKKNNQ